jgi:hypothetical protein
MKQRTMIVISAVCAVALANPAFASKKHAAAPEPVIEEIDHNIMPEAEIDHNAIEADSAADTTIVLPPDPKTIGKPRAKAKASKLPAKEIPLIDTSYEGKSSDDVTYVTGGIGNDEREAIESAKADYNLYILNASASGEFVGDTRVVITRKNGDDVEEVLNVDSGPLLYVRLPAGSYSLVAQLGEQKKEQKLVIAAPGKPTTLNLRWKQAQ